VPVVLKSVRVTATVQVVLQSVRFSAHVANKNGAISHPLLSPGGGRDKKIPLATWHYGASPWRLSPQVHETQAQVNIDQDCWRSAQDILLHDFDRLHPDRVWLRSWH